MKKENEPVGFALQGIKTEQFAILEENYTPTKTTGLNTQLQFKINLEGKAIGVFLSFAFSQDNNVFLKIEVSCHFAIEEPSWNSFMHENSTALTVPKGFAAHMAMLTTGTTRGVLFAKTEGTPFSKFIIPTLNVTEMIPEDITFTIE